MYVSKCAWETNVSRGTERVGLEEEPAGVTCTLRPSLRPRDNANLDQFLSVEVFALEREMNQPFEVEQGDEYKGHDQGAVLGVQKFRRPSDGDGAIPLTGAHTWCIITTT